MKGDYWFRHFRILFRTGMCVILDLIKKYREILSYLFFGVLTTAVDWVIFFLLTSHTAINHHVVNVLAWAAAVLFAFMTNKIWVYQSKTTGVVVVLGELIGFAGGRVLSLGVQELLFFLFVDMMNKDTRLVKIPISILVVIINYVLGKLIFARRTEKKDPKVEEARQEPERSTAKVKNGSIMITDDEIVSVEPQENEGPEAPKDGETPQGTSD